MADQQIERERFNHWYCVIAPDEMEVSNLAMAEAAWFARAALSSSQQVMNCRPECSGTYWAMEINAKRDEALQEAADLCRNDGALYTGFDMADRIEDLKSTPASTSQHCKDCGQPTAPDLTHTCSPQVKPSSVAMTDDWDSHFPPQAELTDVQREARNKVCIDGHLNAALDSVMRSNSPDEKFNILGVLANTAIDIALSLQSSPKGASTGTDAEERRVMQLAGISTAAIGYWKEGDSIHPDYDSVALRDVAKLYAKYVAASQPSAASGRELTRELVEKIASLAFQKAANRCEDYARTLPKSAESNVVSLAAQHIKSIHVPSFVGEIARNELGAHGKDIYGTCMMVAESAFKAGCGHDRALPSDLLRSIVNETLGAALTGAAPADANVGGQTWTDWPDGSGFMGFYWTRAAEDKPLELVHISNAKEGHALQGVICPGISRYYFDFITSRTFKGLQSPTAPEPSAPADKVDAERIQFLEEETMRGMTVNLVFDDDGKWAVSYSASQPMPDGDGQGYSLPVWINCYVVPEEWKPSIREAIDAAIDRMRSESGGSNV